MDIEPEYALLLDAAVPLAQKRADPASWDASRWGTALNVADWHRLSPALYAYLRAAAVAPAAVLNGLERAYLANAARSLYLRATTDRVLAALAAAEVPAMLLKGAALVQTVYPDPAVREMLDIDILVPPDRLGAARGALAPLGFAPVPAGPGSDRWQSAPAHDEALIGEAEVVAVELHRHVAVAGEGHAFTLEGFWERARSAPASGHVIPSVEDLLLHVCFHFTRNRLGGSAHRRNTGGALAQIFDIGRIVEAETVDWDALARQARGYGLGARVFLGLFAAQAVGVPVPPEALASLEPAGFDHAVGRRLVELRVLRIGDHLPVRSTRWMFAPSREALARGWNADPNATLSLARAYMRRARAHAPAARTALRRPWVYVQDQRLNSQIHALEEPR